MSVPLPHRSLDRVNWHVLVAMSAGLVLFQAAALLVAGAVRAIMAAME